MFEIRGEDLYLTRGDSGEFTVSVREENGAELTLEETDALIFTAAVKEVKLVKQADDEGRFVFLPEDTKTLLPGTYEYDIRLHRAEGSVYTVVGRTPERTPHLVLLQEAGE